VPGVQLDRNEHRGHENGQQANAGGKGTVEADKMWSIDGLVVTDMTATGGSPTYFDFDAFEEIASRPAAPTSRPSPAASGSHVTKARHHKFGGRRFFFHHDHCSRATCPTRCSPTPRLQNSDGPFRDKADHIQQIGDYGFDLGGPISRTSCGSTGAGQAGHPPRAPERTDDRPCSPRTTSSSTGKPPRTPWSRASSSTGRRR